MTRRQQPNARLNNFIENTSYGDDGRVQGDDAARYPTINLKPALKSRKAWEQCIKVLVKKEKQGDVLQEMCASREFTVPSFMLTDERKFITALARVLHFLVSVYPDVKGRLNELWAQNLVMPYLSFFLGDARLKIATGLEAPFKGVQTHMKDGEYKHIFHLIKTVLGVIQERFPQLSLSTLYPDSMLPPIFTEVESLYNEEPVSNEVGEAPAAAVGAEIGACQRRSQRGIPQYF